MSLGDEQVRGTNAFWEWHSPPSILLLKSCGDMDYLAFAYEPITVTLGAEYELLLESVQDMDVEFVDPYGTVNPCLGTAAVVARLKRSGERRLSAG